MPFAGSWPGPDWRNHAGLVLPQTSLGVLLRLINQTARHTGHAHATRKFLDGTTEE